MILPEESSQPEPLLPSDDNQPAGEPIRLPPARRRRSRRSLALPGDSERAGLLENLARRAFPSFEFFLFSLLCGAILGAGYLLDSQSLLLLGILLAPLMTPWVGLTLATVTGSWRFFFQTLAGLLIGSVLIFVGGALAGLAARIWMPLPMVQANIHSHLWWPNLFVLVLGAVLLLVSFVRSEEKPILPSVMMTYELYLPLSAAAFGFGSGTANIWPDGLMVFFFYFALAVLVGLVALAFLRFRPAVASGYILSVLIGLSSVVLIVFLSGLGNILSGFFYPPPAPVSLPTLTPSSSPMLPSTSTSTPAAVTPTPTSSPLIPVTPTPSHTPTPQPTPVYARVSSPEGGGALVRSEPGSGGAVIKSLVNDYLVEILPEYQVIDSVMWVKIRTPDDGLVGWMLQSVLALATPVPNP